DDSVWKYIIIYGMLDFAKIIINADNFADYFNDALINNQYEILNYIINKYNYDYKSKKEILNIISLSKIEVLNFFKNKGVIFTPDLYEIAISYENLEAVKFLIKENIQYDIEDIIHAISKENGNKISKILIKHLDFMDNQESLHIITSKIFDKYYKSYNNNFNVLCKVILILLNKGLVVKHDTKLIENINNIMLDGYI